MGKRARAAGHALANLDANQKNAILRAMAAELRSQATGILSENAKDLEEGRENGLSSAMLDRLRLNESRLEAMADGVEQVAQLSDPVGDILDEKERPNGMKIQQVRVPIGVIGIIFESRPNVTSDAAVLCLKSGNATILRGGSEAIHSNRAICDALQAGGEAERALVEEAVAKRVELVGLVEARVPKEGEEDRHAPRAKQAQRRLRLALPRAAAPRRLQPCR